MRWTAVALIIMAAPAQAGVYKCEVDGRTVFSQTSCAEDAQKIEIRATQRDEGNAARLQTEVKQARAELATDSQRRQLVREIARAKKERERLEAKRALLKTKQASANNNLAGATWEQSIVQEMDMVSREYGDRIRSVDDRIEAAQAQLSELD